MAAAANATETALLDQQLTRLRQMEEQLLERIHRGERIARNINESQQEKMTLGERMADGLASFAGSWRFIIWFCVLIAIWVLLNSLLFIIQPWDPYPFILLNLFMSFLASVQAPVIMMSQNRQELRDRLRAEHDYEVNLKAELEIEQLHGKMDELRERQWQELLTIQEQQIQLLNEQVQLLRGLAAR